jgi:hypothetical protein
MTRRLSSGGALVLGALAAAPGLAQETYPNSPFREHPVLLAQAVALQRIVVTAEAYARAPAGVEEDEAAPETADEDEDEGLLAAAVPMFEASLTAQAPEKARALEAALGEMLEARAEGADAAGIAGKVAGLAAEAKAALFPAGVVETAPFQGALLAAALLDEGGVAESYEEASEGEAEGYAIGWTALGRAKALWAELKARGAPEVAAEGDAELARLDALFPGAKMPERLSPDPEEAEAPAHQLVGLTEVVARAGLYPSRDLGAAADVVRDLAAEGCEMLPSDSPKGRELLAIAAAYHGRLLADPLSVMAPEAEERITEGFGDRGEAPECGALLDALGTARKALAS